MSQSMSSVDEELRQRIGRFTQFMRIPAIVCGSLGLAELALMVATGNQQLLGLAVLTLGFGLIAFLATILTDRIRLEAGVYMWSLGSSLLMALLPLVATGLLPAVIAGTTLNILIVALFLSPRQVARAAVILAVLVMISTLLERWTPPWWPRVNMVADLLPILVLVNIACVAAIAFLTNRLGESLLSALESSQANAGQLEQSRLALLERATDLENLSRALRTTGQQAERRAAQLAASAQVAHAASQVRDLDQLLSQVTHLISQAFEHYHVGIFIVDESRRYAVLRGANSEGGRRMLARSHKLAVGTQGIVGFVTGTGQPRVALDVGADAVHFKNPDLPQTHSEMALPMRAGDQIIGALDVQSTQKDAFTEDDVAVLSTLADQLAVAIENARLFQQTRSTLQELEATNRLLVRKGWEGYLEQPATVRRAEAHADGAPIAESLAEPLSVPLELRGQPMGRLTLHREEGRAWSNDEIELIKSVALQATMAADNARLIEQAQIALHESEALYQAASEISGATDLQGICQHVTNSINDLVHADRTTMFLVDRDRKRILFSTGSGNIGDALQMTYAELTSGISGRVLHSGQPVLSLSADDGIEPEETRERRRQSDIGALIIVPLNIKGQVFGTVTAINRCNQPEFTQHDAELLTAFAAQAATAIDNVRLLAETRQRAEREQLIRQITTRIRAAGDIQGVLEVTAAELARSMGVPRAIVRLTMGDST